MSCEVAQSQPSSRDVKAGSLKVIATGNTLCANFHTTSEGSAGALEVSTVAKAAEVTRGGSSGDGAARASTLGEGHTADARDIEVNAAQVADISGGTGYDIDFNVDSTCSGGFRESNSNSGVVASIGVGNVAEVDGEAVTACYWGSGGGANGGGARGSGGLIGVAAAATATTTAAAAATALGKSRTSDNGR
uniref:Uncharacterized protein n=1 Tax=Planktothricoides sp. SpSt-374 TaxID=2282167 RepID=A0A7C3ZP13_9CYAN